MIDGVPHRLRRGKWVPIPKEWLGKVASRQKINKRPSKQLHKHRKLAKLGDYNNRKQKALERLRDEEMKDAG